ncbi:MAG: hypothetical protein HN742_21485 [Lentisphaerae bacterium]|jgi:hypothetical protein|nr:hypothetical protein [Lentisphaerota bacterium]MBT4817330.1 hypothetical protein [Lentisphaerota bacterium]MBT5613093.1 hypothetical protein [Lentisphaerota bacterium]MBT7056435.1 hypothetical protein [Lentisphaerota bacterium]MBT7844464.1 hypothetical protein [Lentisphaerota bacterium]
MSRTKGSDQRFESLQEMILVAALSLMLAGVAVQLFHCAWDYGRACRSEAFTRREIALLATAWRKHVGTVTDPIASVGIEEGTLVLNSDGQSRSLRLAAGVGAHVATERRPGEPPFHVLTLTWTQKRLSKDYVCTARIVACPDGAQGDDRS